MNQYHIRFWRWGGGGGNEVVWLEVGFLFIEQSFDADSEAAMAGSRNCLNATFRVPRGVLIFVPFGLNDGWSLVVDFYSNKIFTI